MGFSTRQVVRLASRGVIPGAHQPSGPGGAWKFDLKEFEEWWESTKAKPDTWSGIGWDAPQRRIEKSEKPLRKRLKKLLDDALKQAEPASRDPYR